MSTWQIIIAITVIIVTFNILGVVIFKNIRSVYEDYYYNFISPSVYRNRKWYTVVLEVFATILLSPLLLFILLFGSFLLFFVELYRYFGLSREKRREMKNHARAERRKRAMLSFVKNLDSQLADFNYFKEKILNAGRLRNSVIPPQKYPEAAYSEIILLDFTDDSSVESLVEAKRREIDLILDNWNSNHDFRIVSKKHPLSYSEEVGRYYAPSREEREGKALSLSSSDVLDFFGFDRSDVERACIIHLKYKVIEELRNPQEHGVNGAFCRYGLDFSRGDILDFTLFPLDDIDSNFFVRDFYSILKVLRPDNGVYFSQSSPEKDADFADNDFAFSGRLSSIADEIKERIEKLRLHGVGEAAILSLLGAEPKLSHLKITKDFRIFLPDYDSREIELSPLHKAIYFLFLKHPEGILFKELVDYKAELRELYLSISDRISIKTMEASIDSVCDSTSNSINEKCSRIRAAFLKEFSERIADNYCIVGKAKEKKHIPIASRPDMVTWE